VTDRRTWVRHAVDVCGAGHKTATLWARSWRGATGILWLDGARHADAVRVDDDHRRLGKFRAKPIDVHHHFRTGEQTPG
jgi:hypothetical protein